jgi:hypothetical protein
VDQGGTVNEGIKLEYVGATKLYNKLDENWLNLASNEQS